MKSTKLIAKCMLASGAMLMAGAAFADTVYSTSSFTNPTALSKGAPAGGGWYFNNVRNGGSAAVNTLYPRSGDGSVSLSGPANAKADIEFLPNAVSVYGNYYSNGSLGALADLSSMSYDWFRAGSSAAAAGQHPALRVLIDVDGNLATGDRGGLVFERAYNGPTSSVDAWISEVISDSTNLWNFGTPLGSGGNINASPYAYDATLAQWKAYFPNAAIIGFSAGIGSGWQSFAGAVDNIAWTIDGVTTAANFDTQAAAAVPEPASLALLALGMFGIGAARRRSR